ncbi:MAG: helix-turn-helix domain-containing protein [Chloroflexota bacterium]|nr:helix-turn-helix domain-containing protein [Chloroflexota bacterium]
MRVNGAKLRRARERRALSLRELAEEAGVSYVTVWRIERETTGPARPITVRRLAGALGVEPETLIEWGTDDAGETEAETGKAAA